MDAHFLSNDASKSPTRQGSRGEGCDWRVSLQPAGAGGQAGSRAGLVQRAHEWIHRHGVWRGLRYLP